MKINNYAPSLSALPINLLTNSITEAKQNSIEVSKLRDLFDLTPGLYLISISTPRSNLPAKAHQAYSVSFLRRSKTDVTYFIPQAIINVGEDTIQDMFRTIKESSNKLKEAVAQHLPIYSQAIINDVDFIIKHFSSELP